MQLKNVKVGAWYETKLGTGECLRVGGTHPPTAQFNISRPLPRGRQYVAPRDVIREVAAPEGK